MREWIRDRRVLRLGPLAALVMTQGFILARFAEPILGGDTGRLLEESHNLIAGRPLGPTGIPFFLPHAILAAVQLAGLPLVAYVYVQVAAAAVAVLALWELVVVAGGTAAVATIVSLIWVLNPDTQRWNFFLLSDGLYQSLLIITTLTIVKAIDGRRVPWMIAASVSVIAIVLTRPQGQLWPAILVTAMLFRPPALSERSESNGLPRVFRWSVAGAAIALQLLIVNAGRAYASHMDMVQHFEHGQIIWGYSGYLLTMPAAPANHGPGLSSVIAYVVQHPFDSLRLVAARISAEVITLRPFYSRFHNALNVELYFPMYACAITAWWRQPSSTAKTACLIIVAAHLAFVGASHADSDGRWFMQIFPLILVWGGVGAAAWIRARANQGMSR